MDGQNYKEKKNYRKWDTVEESEEENSSNDRAHFKIQKIAKEYFIGKKK